MKKKWLIWLLCATGVVVFGLLCFTIGRDARRSLDLTSSSLSSSPTNNQSRDPSSLNSESSMSGQENQQITVSSPPPPAVIFKSDPDNKLTMYDMDRLNTALESRHMNEVLEGKWIRVQGRVFSTSRDYFTVAYTQPFLFHNFDMFGIPADELDSLKEGDLVEIVCQYGQESEDTSPSGGQFVSRDYAFSVKEIHKL